MSLGWATNFVVAGALALAAVPGPGHAQPPGPQATVTGTASYRERIKLPRDAVFEASLEDVARAGAPSKVLGTARIEGPRIPIEFSIAYDPARVDPAGRYAVRARITAAGRLLFTTDRIHPVPLGAGASHVDIVLHKAQAKARAPGTRLEGTYWKLIALKGQPAKLVPPPREAHFVLQPDGRRVAGSGGCNRLMGSYALDRERLSFDGLGSTKMACPDSMEQERAFLEALATVARWRIDGTHLALIDARGDALLQFEAQPRR